MRTLLLTLLCLACSGAPEATPGEFAQPAAAGAAGAPSAPVPIPSGVPARACGCDDMTIFTIPPGECFAIAYGIWGSVEDDVACFDLTPDDDACSRTCAGYLEIKNETAEPMRIAAFDKLVQSQPGTAQPGVMLADVKQCDRMFNGPQPTDSYKNEQPFINGLRFAGGPTAETFPPPGKDVCP